MCVCVRGGGGAGVSFFYYESKFIKNFIFRVGGVRGGTRGSEIF